MNPVQHRAMNERTWTVPLGASLFLSLSAFVLLMVLALVWTVQSVTRGVLERQAELQLNESVRGAEQLLLRRVEPVHLELQVLQGQLLREAPEDKAGLRARYSQILRELPYIASLSIADEKGQEWTFLRDGTDWVTWGVRQTGSLAERRETRWDADAGQAIEETIDIVDYDPRKQAWYRSSLEAAQEIPLGENPSMQWTNFQEEGNEHSFIMGTLATTRGSQLLGVVTVVVDPQALGTVLAQETRSQAGTLLAQWEGTLILPVSETAPAGASKSEVTVRVKSVPTHLEHAVNQWKTGKVRAGEAVPYSDTEGSGWFLLREVRQAVLPPLLVGIALPRHLVAGPGETAQGIVAMVGSLGLLLAALLAFGVAHAVRRPLHAFVERAQQGKVEQATAGSWPKTHLREARELNHALDVLFSDISTALKRGASRREREEIPGATEASIPETTEPLQEAPIMLLQPADAGETATETGGAETADGGEAPLFFPMMRPTGARGRKSNADMLQTQMRLELASLKTEREAWLQDRVQLQEELTNQAKKAAEMRLEVVTMRDQHERLVWDHERVREEQGAAVSLTPAQTEELAALRSQRETWMRERTMLVEEREALEDAGMETRLELAGVREEREKALQERARLVEQLAQQEKLTPQLKAALISLRNERTVWVQEKAHVQQEREAQVQAMSMLREELATLQEEHARLLQAAQEQERAAQETNLQLVALRAMQADWTEREEITPEMQQELLSLKDERQRCEVERVRLHEERAGWTADLKRAALEKEQLARQRGELAAEREQLSALRAQLSQEKEEFARERKGLLQLREAAQSQRQAAQEEEEAVRSERSALQVEREELERLRRAMKDRETQLQQEKDKFAQEMVTLSDRCAVLATEMAQLDRQCAGLLAQEEALKSERYELAGERETMGAAREEMEQVRLQIEQGRRRLEEEQEGWSLHVEEERDRSQLQVERQAVQQEQGSLQARREAMQQELAELEARQAALALSQQEVETRQQGIQVRAAEVEQAWAELQVAQRQADQVRAQMEVERKAHLKTQRDLENREAALSARQEAVESMHRANLAAGEVMELEQASLLRETLDLALAKKDSQSEAGLLTRQREELEAETQALSAAREAWERTDVAGQLALLEEEREAAAQARAQVELEQVGLNSAAAALQVREENLSAAQIRHDHAVAEIARRQAALDETARALELERQSAVAEIKLMEAERLACGAELDAVRAERTSLQAEHAALRAERQSLAEELEYLAREREQLERERGRIAEQDRLRDEAAHALAVRQETLDQRHEELAARDKDLKVASAALELRERMLAAQAESAGAREGELAAAAQQLAATQALLAADRAALNRQLEELAQERQTLNEATPPEGHRQALELSRKQLRTLKTELEDVYDELTETAARMREAQERLLVQRETLVHFAGQSLLRKEAVEDVLRQSTEAVSKALGARRTSIWLADEQLRELVCSDRFDSTSQTHDEGQTLDRAAHAMFFMALESESIIAPSDAESDPRLQDVRALWTNGNGGHALMIAPVRVGEQVAAAVVVEAEDELREWQADEQNFAVSFAQLLVPLFEAPQAAPPPRPVAAAEPQTAPFDELGEAPDYRYMVESTEGLLWSVSPDGRIQFTNPATARAFGYDALAMLGRKLQELAVPEGVAIEAEAIRAVLDGAESQTYTNWYQRRGGGEAFCLQVTLSALQDESGDLIGCVAAAGPPVGIVQAPVLAPVVPAPAHLRETAHELFWALDREGVLTDVSDAACSLFGFDREELLGKNVFDFCTIRQAKKDRARLSTLLSSGECTGYKTTYTARDGAAYDLLVLAEVIRDEKGLATGAKGLAIDLSLRRVKVRTR